MGRFRLALISMALTLISLPAYAECTAPDGYESQTRFTSNIMYYCDGTDWQPFHTAITDTGLGCVEGSFSLVDGATHDFYSAASAGDCAAIRQTRTCTAGVLSGSSTYQNPSCITLSGCTLDGHTVAHGTAHTFYTAATHANCASIAQSRTCTNGVLGGSAVYNRASCAGSASCSLDGQTVTHTNSRTFYSTTTHANCASVSQSRTCTNGVLNGSATFQYANCTAPANCSLDGVTVNNGSARMFYTATSHANCASIGQSRTCTGGTLSGSATYNRANCTNTTPGVWVYTSNVATAAACNAHADCTGGGVGSCNLGTDTTCCLDETRNTYTCAASAARKWTAVGMTWGAACGPNPANCPGKSVFDTDINGYPGLNGPCNAPSAATTCGYDDPEVVNCLQVRCQ